jgi:DNA helicase-2/ATP-dependent DNA helicase PcrA
MSERNRFGQLIKEFDVGGDFPPTPEQSHILDLVRSTPDNLMINALAGAGKTSTLELIHAAVPGPVLFLAFNVRVKETMEERIAEKIESGINLPPITIKTLNGLGNAAWKGAIGKQPVVSKTKTADLLRQAIAPLSKSEKDEAYEYFWDITAAVGYAKAHGYIPEGKFPDAKRLLRADAFFDLLEERPSELFRHLVDQTLLASIKAAYAGSIDYNDQLYMPTLFGGTFPNHPVALIDEFQDFSPINFEMLDKLKESRLIAVGDPWQSIYAFRGAVQSGMTLAKERFAMREANLSVSFRCPEIIVKSVHWRVPHMRWTREGGVARRHLNPDLHTFVDGCAIICRNNAPLFNLALRLLAVGRSVRIVGSEIGPKVVGIMKKLGPPGLPREGLLSAISDWLYDKLERESTTAEDLAGCMVVFAKRGHNLSEAVAYAEDLFAQRGELTLTTGHKAKGLEWPVVYHLDPWLIKDGEQELNLRYVIQTRAQEEYYELDSRDIR